MDEKMQSLLKNKIWRLMQLSKDKKAVGVVSKYMHDASKEYWQAVKRILWYIQNTVDVGLVFEQDIDVGQYIVGYCDSDYTGDLDKHRSTTGCLFTLVRALVS